MQKFRHLHQVLVTVLLGAACTWAMAGALDIDEALVVAVIDRGVLPSDSYSASILLPGNNMVFAPSIGRGGRYSTISEDELSSGCEGCSGQNDL